MAVTPPALTVELPRRCFADYSLRRYRRAAFFALIRRFRRHCEFSFPAVCRQWSQGHGDVATGDLRDHFYLRHAGEIVAHFFHELHTKFLMRHFAAAKLQLHTHLVSAVQEFFTVPDFRHVIVFVDVNTKLDFLQFRAGRLFVLGVFGNVVSELSERDDFANRRIRRGRNLDQIKANALGFAQGIRQFHDAELFACGSQNNSDFAGANPTVYTKLLLQIKSSSWPAERECAATPYFRLSQFPASATADSRAL